ncbi:MAG: hypothetical protein PWR31_2075 [Bacillota bacterium]|nr:hypothetical protein [Bacillota bacterium]
MLHAPYCNKPRPYTAHRPAAGRAAARAAALTLTLLLLLPAGTVPLKAQAPGGNFGVYLTGRERAVEFLQALRFRDLPAGPAAVPLLRLAAQGVLRGDGSGDIRPDAVITRQEAIVALVRLLGLEGEVAGAVRGTSSSASGGAGGAAPWAQGYVAVAGTHGITGGSAAQAVPGAGGPQQAWDAPATREEVAAWAVRALGPAAAAAGGASGLLATYTDGGEVSPEFRPLVERALELGLVEGPTPLRLAPRGGLTRAELAEILDALAHRLPPTPAATWQLGTITAQLAEDEDLGGRPVRSTLLEITGPGGSTSTLKLTVTPAGTPLKDTVVLRSGRLALGDSLRVGETIRYLVTGDGVVPFAEVLPDAVVTLTGTLEEIEPSAGTLRLRDAAGQSRSLALLSYTAVSIAGRPATPADLAAGETVTVRAVAGTAWQVAAAGGTPGTSTEPAGAVVSGRVRYRDAEHLALTLQNGEEVEYELSAATQVLAGGRTADLDAVQPGDQVEVQLGGADGTWVERLTVAGAAGRVAGLYRGRLGSFAPRGGEVILTEPERLEGGTWQPAGSAALRLPLSPAATLWLGGREVDLATAARYSGHDAYAAVNTGFGRPEALQLVIKTGQEKAYEGRVEEVNPALGEVKLSSGTIALSPGAIVLKAGRLTDAYALAEDDSIQALVSKEAAGSLGLVVQVLGRAEALPGALTVYKGQVDEVGQDAWTLDHYYTLSENEWDYHGRRASDDLGLSRDTLILSLLGAAPEVLTPAEFRQGYFRKQYGNVLALAVTEGDETLGLALWPEEDLGGERLSAGRVAGVAESGSGATLTLAEARDFSPAKNAWQTATSPQRLSLTGALVIKDGRAQTWEGLAVGDTVDVLRRGQQGLLILVKE